MLDLLSDVAAARPDAVAHAVDGGGALSFGEWARRSELAARSLLGLGVRPGDRVALVFDRARWTDLAVAHTGVLAAGGVAVPFAPRRLGCDLARALRHCRPAGVVAPSDLDPGAGHGWTVEHVWTVAPQELDHEPPSPAPPPARAPRPDDPAEVLYPPGAMRVAHARSRSHRDLVGSWPLASPVPDRLVHALPVGSSAATGALVAPLLAGHPQVVALPGLDVSRLCALAGGEGVTAAAVPSCWAGLLVDRDDRREALAGLTHLLLHGDVAPPLRARLWTTLPRTTITDLSPGGPPPMPPPGVEDTAPVPPFLEGMVWHEQLAAGTFNLPPLVRRYQGRLDVAALASALSEIVRRHASLRTTFTIARGRPAQLVWPSRPLDMATIDLCDLPAPERDHALGAIVADAGSRPMDLVTGPLFEPVLVRLGADDHVLVVRAHISVYDDFSIGPFRRELSALYEAFLSGQPSPLPEPALQFADLSRAQRRSLDGPSGADQHAFWAGELAGAPLSVQLPLDDPRRPVGSPHPPTDPLVLQLGPEVSAGIRALARAERATPFMVVLAAFAVLVQRYTGQDDLLVSTVVGNRTGAASEAMIGCLSRKVPIRLRLHGDPLFAELVGRARAALMGAISHPDLGHDQVLHDALGAPAGDHGLVPQVGVKLQASVASDERLHLPGITVSAPPSTTAAARPHFQAGAGRASSEPPAPPWGAGLYLRTFLSLSLADDGTGLRLVSEGAFHPEAGRRLLRHFRVLLEDVVSDPHRQASELSLLDSEARAELVHQGGDPEASPSRHQGLHQAVAAVAARSPGRVAVVSGRATVTYGELDARSGRLAAVLRAAGVARDSLVGVCLRPGAEVVVAVLAAWRAGAAFVGLDPDDPPGHLARVMAEAGLEVVVGVPGTTAGAAGRPLRLIDASEADGQVAAPAGPGDRRSGGGEGDLACVQLGGTPSSPGAGVELTHGALMSAWSGLLEAIGTGASTGSDHPLAVAFDASPAGNGFLRQLGHLADGHRLHVVPGAGGGAAELVALLRSGDVDVVHVAGENLGQLLDSGLRDALAARAGGSAATVVIASTDPPDEARWQEWRLLPAALQVYAVPGCPVAAAACRAGEVTMRPGVGRPLAGVTAHVLDRRGEPVPFGVAGELHLGGPSLARGYWARPDLSAARFRPDPFAPGRTGRLHATGQLARRHPDGTIEPLGDTARLVDLGGFRVDPARMEAALGCCPGVARVRVVPEEAGTGARRLVAQVVPTDHSRPPTLGQLRRHLWTRLPGYAWPAELVLVDGTGTARGRPAPVPPAPELGDEGDLLVAAWSAARRFDDAGGEGGYWQSFSFLDAVTEAHDAGLEIDLAQVARNRGLEALATDLAAGGSRQGRGVR